MGEAQNFANLVEGMGNVGGWVRKSVGPAIQRNRLANEVQRLPFVPAMGLLPAEVWITCPELRFGLPFGWVGADREEVNLLSSRSAGMPVLAAASNFVTNSRGCNIKVFRVGDFAESVAFEDIYGDLHNVIQSFEEAANGQHLGGPFFVLVGGERAVVFHYQFLASAANYGGSVDELTTTTVALICHRGAMVMAQIIGFSDQHHLWLPGLYTALGTWQWAT